MVLTNERTNERTRKNSLGKEGNGLVIIVTP